MTQTSTPATIAKLIAEAVEIGGTVTETHPRRFEFALPCRVVGGKVKLVVRGTVCYYVREDGKNKISGSHVMRAEIAHWARQSRSA